MNILMINLRVVHVALTTVALLLLTASTCPAQKGAGWKVCSYLNSTLRTESLALAVTSLAEGDSVILSVTDVRAVAGDSVRVQLALTNETSAAYLLPKFDARDLCSSLLNLYIFDSSTSCRVFPCREIVQLDEITLNEANSIVLTSHSSHSDSITFSARDASILSKHGNYRLKVSLLLGDTNVIASEGEAWKKNLQSTPFGFHH